MSFEFLIDPEHGPQWKNLLPGRPAPYVLRKGEGEHSMLFTDLFSVLLSGDETNNQFGIITSDCPVRRHHPDPLAQRDPRDVLPARGQAPAVLRGRRAARRHPKLLTPGDFGYVPAGTPHAYQVEEAARILGVMTGGFERFFQHMGTVTDNGTKDQPPFIPDFPRMKAAAQQHNMQFMPDFDGRTRRLSARTAVTAAPSPGGSARATPRRAAARARARCRTRRTASGVGFSPGSRMPPSPGSGRSSWICGCPPAGDEPSPVVVFLHGGGWRLGSRHSAGPAYAKADPGPFELVAQAGIAVASIDYRLSGEAVWPAQLHDAKAAVRWLRGRASELTIDPDRIAAWGESAGGHLAELLGLTVDDPALEGDGRRRRPVERGRGRRRLVRAERRRARSPRTSAVTRWTRRPGRRSCWAPRRRRCRSSPRRPARSATSRPARAAVPAAARPGRPDGARASRANGCTPHCWRPAPTPSCTCTRAPTTCGWARPDAAADAVPGRSSSCSDSSRSRRTASETPRETTHEDRRQSTPGQAAVQVAALSDDGTKVTVIAPLAEFWSDAAGYLTREPAGPTLDVAGGATGPAGPPGRQGDLHRAELPQARRRGQLLGRPAYRSTRRCSPAGPGR